MCAINLIGIIPDLLSYLLIVIVCNKGNDNSINYKRCLLFISNFVCVLLIKERISIDRKSYDRYHTLSPKAK